MTRLKATLGIFAFLLLTGGNCSRARVESMTALNNGIVLAQRGQHLQAIEQLQAAAAHDPTNDGAFYAMTQVQMEMSNFQAAKESVNRAIAVRGDYAPYHEKLGTIAMQLEDWGSAKTALERTIELEPKLYKAYYKLAYVLEKQNDLQGALQRYTECIKAGPRYIGAYQSLGRLYADLDMLPQATQVLEAGLQVAMPGSVDEANLHALVGTVYQENNDLPQAITHFRDALRVLPSHSDALFSIGWAYGLSNNNEECKRYLKRFVDSAAEDTPSSYLAAARGKLAQLGASP